MKNLLLITIALLSFNSMATSLLVAATCTGSFMDEGELIEMTIYAQENHMNYCQGTENDTNGALVIIDKNSNGGFESIEGAPAIELASISIDGDFKSTYLSTIDAKNSIKLEYSFNDSNGLLTIDYDGVKKNVKMVCTYPQYNMDC